MSDWEERFPQQMSEDQQQAILDQLNTAHETLRKKKEQEESQTASEGQEIPSEGDNPTYSPQANTEAFGQSPQEQLEQQWQDSFEGIETEPGEHTTQEFERLLKTGQASKTFDVSEGNSISIRTLKQDEELEAIKRSSAYPTAMQSRVFILYCVSQSLQALNNKAWFKRKPLSKEDDILEEKFKALCNLYAPVIERLIAEYNQLSSETLQKAQYAKKE